MATLEIDVRDFVEEQYEELCEADENFDDILAHEIEKIISGNFDQYQQHRARKIQQMSQQVKGEVEESRDTDDER